MERNGTVAQYERGQQTCYGARLINVPRADLASYICHKDGTNTQQTAIWYKLVMFLFHHHSGVYNNCKDALAHGQTTSGVYNIQPDSQPAFQAYCDMETDGGGWTVFQRRMDESVDFYRSWTDYQQGFGNLSGEFWLGLDKIHRLTSTATELRVDMQDFEGNSAYAQYTSFSVGDSASKYNLTVSGYSGTAGDSLTNTALLQATVYITSLAQEIKIMMCGVAIVHSVSRVPGGMVTAIPQTSTVSTMVDHTRLMLMV